MNRCQHCGRTDNLVSETYVDEDGFRYEDASDICEGCCEISEERRRQRIEWQHYEETPCPEIEMTPYPGRKGQA